MSLIVTKENQTYYINPNYIAYALDDGLGSFQIVMKTGNVINTSAEQASGLIAFLQRRNSSILSRLSTEEFTE